MYKVKGYRSLQGFKMGYNLVTVYSVGKGYQGYGCYQFKTVVIWKYSV